MFFISTNSWRMAFVPPIAICVCLVSCLVELKDANVPASERESTQELCQPETVMNQGCNVCTCNDDGKWECSDHSCEYSPCEDKVCGEACTECPPWELSPPCEESLALKTCNEQSQCVVAPVECTMPPPNESDDAESNNDESTGTGGTTTDSEPEAEDSTSDQDPDVVNSVMIDCEDTQHFNDQTHLTALEIDGDQLSAMVGYSGSCIDDQFQLCWNGLFLESSPEKVVFKLGHEDFDDACDDWVEDRIHFDLSRLREAWLSEHKGKTNGSIQIHMISRVNSEVQAEILYEF